jgi:hypothetical protein
MASLSMASLPMESIEFSKLPQDNYGNLLEFQDFDNIEFKYENDENIYQGTILSYTKKMNSSIEIKIKVEGTEDILVSTINNNNITTTKNNETITILFKIQKYIEFYTHTHSNFTTLINTISENIPTLPDIYFIDLNNLELFISSFTKHTDKYLYKNIKYLKNIKDITSQIKQGKIISIQQDKRIRREYDINIKINGEEESNKYNSASIYLLSERGKKTLEIDKREEREIKEKAEREEREILEKTKCGFSECTKLVSGTCKQCHSVFYCSEDHQKKHWPSHKSICLENRKKILQNYIDEIWKKLKKEINDIIEKIKKLNQDIDLEKLKNLLILTFELGENDIEDSLFNNNIQQTGKSLKTLLKDFLNYDFNSDFTQLKSSKDKRKYIKYKNKYLSLKNKITI